MADTDPELEAELGSLKSSKHAKVKVTYKDLKSSGQTDHRVGWSRLADEWLSRSFNNRLELTWRSVPRDILKGLAGHLWFAAYPDHDGPDSGIERLLGGD